MENVKLYARAKINPALNVIEKLDNGYHSLDMIMQSLNLCDTIYIEKTLTNKIEIYSNISWLAKDKKNLVYQCADYLKRQYDIKHGIRINLTKKIPISAGLAGGSTDCATTLIGLRSLFRLPINNEELLEIGKNFGADVPFCIKRGTYLARGIGEKLTPLPSFPYCYILVAKPQVSLSTSYVFENLDLSKVQRRPDIEKIIYYLKKQDLENVSSNLCNVLESVSIKKYPIIKDIKDDMIVNGALGSLMSGSGSSVFGIFKNKAMAVNARNKLYQKYKLKELFVTIPFNMG